MAAERVGHADAAGDEGHMLNDANGDADQAVLNAQRQHWERTFSSKPGMFGDEASYPARAAADLFRREGKNTILELGGGQGRDSLFFAGNGLDVTVLDYSGTGLREIEEKARGLGVAQAISTVRHDVRRPLPFLPATFDAVYSHMLFCMALTTAELLALSGEIRRILKPGGLSLFTVRTKQDAHYGTGICRGEDMYEVGGFIVHFFDKAKVEQVAAGYERVSVEEFEEGGLPRKLFLVTLHKHVG
jgi:SAM-dependent methyltransferase